MPGEEEGIVAARRKKRTKVVVVGKSQRCYRLDGIRRRRGRSKVVGEERSIQQHHAEAERARKRGAVMGTGESYGRLGKEQGSISNGWQQ